MRTDMPYMFCPNCRHLDCNNLRSKTGLRWRRAYFFTINRRRLLFILLLPILLGTAASISATETIVQNPSLPHVQTADTEFDTANTEQRIAELTNKFNLRLESVDITNDRTQLLLAHATRAFGNIAAIESEEQHDMHFPDWFSAGSAIPPEVLDEGTLSTNTFPNGELPTDFTNPSLRSAMYLGNLIYQRHCNQNATAQAQPENPMPPEILIDEPTMQKPSSIKKQIDLSAEELRLLHRFMLDEKIWTTQDYEIVELAIARMNSDKNNELTKDNAFQPEFIC